ncbi:hypothetical protein [Mycolicibacterium fortuitum]|uniref:hypothetical protein n=1 Tax=Mycolicibacterium fortuitum TaxID=1766 RepID=UPI003AABA858
MLEHQERDQRQREHEPQARPAVAPPQEVAARAHFPARPETTVQPAALAAVLAEPEQHPQPPTRSGSPPQTPEASRHSPAHQPPQRPMTPAQRQPQATPKMPPPALPRQTTMPDQKPSTPAPTPTKPNAPVRHYLGSPTSLARRSRQTDSVNRRRLPQVMLRCRRRAQQKVSMTQPLAKPKDLGRRRHHSPVMNHCCP